MRHGGKLLVALLACSSGCGVASRAQPDAGKASLAPGNGADGSAGEDASFNALFGGDSGPGGQSGTAGNQNGQDCPEAIALDSTSVYWTTSRAVMKAPLSGGAPIALASGQTRPWALAVDGTNVYWTTGDGNIMRISVDGGTPSTLASGQSNPNAIALDSTSVYWANAGQAAGPKMTFDGIASNSGTLMKMPLGGGIATTLATGQDDPEGVAVDSTSVYWTNWGLLNPGVLKIPLGGGTPIVLASGGFGYLSIAVDTTSLYWTQTQFAACSSAAFCDPSVTAMPLDGGTAITLASGQGQISGIAIDSTNVYWTSFPNGDPYMGTVRTAPLGGGTVTTLASSQMEPAGIAVSATSVYWTYCDIGPYQGSVRSLTPK